MKWNNLLIKFSLLMLIATSCADRRVEWVSEYYNPRDVKTTKKEIDSRRHARYNEFDKNKFNYKSFHESGRKKIVHKNRDIRRVNSPHEQPLKTDLVKYYDQDGKLYMKVVNHKNGKKEEFYYTKGKLMLKKTSKKGKIVRIDDYGSETNWKVYDKQQPMASNKNKKRKAL